MPHFQYHNAIFDRYPSVSGGVILAKGVRNSPTPPDLLQMYQNEQAVVRASIGNTPLSQIESLAGWRNAFRGFGVDPTQYRSAAEALLRRLTKKGDIPSINMLVDIGNLASIRYALPVAVFDLRSVQGMVTVQFAKGTERFTPLGESVVEHPEPGEVIFADETGLVLARRWCWRQSDESAARLDTTNAIITVEAQHPGARPVLQQALDTLVSMLGKYTGGAIIFDILDKEYAAI